MRTTGGCCDVGALSGSKELQMAFPYLEEGTLAPYFPGCHSQHVQILCLPSTLWASSLRTFWKTLAPIEACPSPPPPCWDGGFPWRPIASFSLPKPSSPWWPSQAWNSPLACFPGTPDSGFLATKLSPAANLKTSPSPQIPLPFWLQIHLLKKNNKAFVQGYRDGGAARGKWIPTEKLRGVLSEGAGRAIVPGESHQKC